MGCTSVRESFCTMRHGGVAQSPFMPWASTRVAFSTQNFCPQRPRLCLVLPSLQKPHLTFFAFISFSSTTLALRWTPVSWSHLWPLMSHVSRQSLWVFIFFGWHWPSCLQLPNDGIKGVSHYHLAVSLLDWFKLIQPMVTLNSQSSISLCLPRVEIKGVL